MFGDNKNVSLQKSILGDRTMNIKIGMIIKKLRAEKNVTQDTPATAIGVTPHAISR